MKKSKTDFDAATAILQKHIQTAQGGLEKDLCSLMKKLLNESNARGIRYMIAYYGLETDQGMTLESIGDGMAGGLTRERVRQIIDTALGYLKKIEPSSDQKPYGLTIEKFNNLMGQVGNKGFIELKELTDDSYFKGFNDNTKGLISFLNDAGIRQVVYRGVNYIYPERLDRKKAIALIQDENKKVRRAKTLSKMEAMSKTVTYVPSKTREQLQEYAKQNDIALNRLYEQILNEFMSVTPYKDANDFEKTQSWRARQGKAQWSQVGIYIAKDIFDQVKETASQFEGGVSNMAYISQAFVWFSKKIDKE